MHGWKGERFQSSAKGRCRLCSFHHYATTSDVAARSSRVCIFVAALYWTKCAIWSSFNVNRSFFCEDMCSTDLHFLLTLIPKMLCRLPVTSVICHQSLNVVWCSVFELTIGVGQTQTDRQTWQTDMTDDIRQQWQILKWIRPRRTLNVKLKRMWSYPSFSFMTCMSAWSELSGSTLS